MLLESLGHTLSRQQEQGAQQPEASPTSSQPTWTTEHLSLQDGPPTRTAHSEESGFVFIEKL